MATAQGTILLTGANGGLGSAIAGRIATRPSLYATAHTIYTVRSAAAVEAVQSAIAHENAPSYDIVQLELSDLDSIRSKAASINKQVSAGKIPRIQALILNAGFRETGRQTWTEDGLDPAFASNYLGHWLFTLLLLPSMDREIGRIVIIGGIVHDPQDRRNKINKAFETEPWKCILADASNDSVESIATGAWAASPDDPAQDPRQLYGIRRYGASKLFEVMMIPELQRRLDQDPILKNISVLGVDPGTMPTFITVGPQNWLVRIIFLVVARIACIVSPNGVLRMPHKSAVDVLTAALNDELPRGKHPKGLYFCGSELGEISDEAKNAEKRASVWKASVQYARLKETETCLANWR